MHTQELEAPVYAGAGGLADVAQLLGTFAGIGLDELRGASLLDRSDTKFVAPVTAVPSLLRAAANDYRALTIGGRRLFGYETRYFDTPALSLYHAHHAGRRPRAKIRVREYRDSGERFLELKLRTRAGTTTKQRVALNGGAALPFESLVVPGSPVVPELRDALNEVVRVTYQRITLVHVSAPERITIDIGLSLHAQDSSARYPDVAFVEVKQARRGSSPFIDALRAEGVRGRGVSKYCLGVARLVPGVRSNRFRHAFNRLERLGAPDNAAV